MKLESLETLYAYYISDFKIEYSKLHNNILTSGLKSEEIPLESAKVKREMFNELITKEEYFHCIDNKIQFIEDFKRLFSELASKDNEETLNEYNKITTDKSLVMKIKLETLEENIRKITREFLEITKIFVNNESEDTICFKKNITGGIPEPLEKMLKEYSESCVEILLQELKEEKLSIYAYELIPNHLTHNYSNLQMINPEPWVKLYDTMRAIELIEAKPLLKKYLQQNSGSNEPLTKKQESYLIKKHILCDINKKELMRRNQDKFMIHELKNLQRIIKELFGELKAGDEVTLQTALAVLKENIELVLIEDQELEQVLIELVQTLPDFEYVRLKKSFRRKDTI